MARRGMFRVPLRSRRSPMKMTYRALAAVTLLVAPALSAQAPAAPPKPGPEVQKLAYFAGRWSEVADMKASPMGPGGKATVSSSCEWFSGGFFLVCRSDGTNPEIGRASCRERV